MAGSGKPAMKLVIPSPAALAAEWPAGAASDPAGLFDATASVHSRDFAFFGETLVVAVVLSPPESSTTEELADFRRRYSAIRVAATVTPLNEPAAKGGSGRVNGVQHDSSRFHPTSLSSLPFAELADSPFAAGRLGFTPAGDLVYLAHVQLVQIPPSVETIVISATVVLHSDPLCTVPADSWAQEVRQMCNISMQQVMNGSTSATAALSKEIVSLNLKLLPPPHVFCNTASVMSSRLVSVEVHNNIDQALVLNDLAVHLVPQHSLPESSTGTDGAAHSTDASRSTSASVDLLAGAVGELSTAWRKARSAMRATLRSPANSPVFGRKSKGSSGSGGSATASGSASTTSSSTSRKSNGKSSGSSGGTSANNSSDTAEALAFVVPLSCDLPQALEPDSRYAFASEIQLSPTATQNMKEMKGRMSRVLVSMAFSTPLLFTPISCQYELFAVQPKAHGLSLVMAHDDPIHCGDTFYVTYTLFNASSTMYHNLFINIAPPALDEHQATLKQRSSDLPFELHAKKLVERQSTLLQQSIMNNEEIPLHDRAHACALDRDIGNQCGLLCLEKKMHLGACAPNSQTSITVPFVAQAAGVYQVGLVELSEHEQKISAFNGGHKVYVNV